MDEVIRVKAREGHIVTVNGVKVTDAPKRVSVSEHANRLLLVGDLLLVCEDCQSAPCECAEEEEN